ncbi:Nuclear transport factor 2 family protein [Sulfidibacter corallicola]|uniref:Nuclear transport factor 2 family protein n=1 Tax=Sulfidibacter corallicola TaxID=2818388 RepID=A0A8A4U4Y3_SULCO|nr:nuclear transport factor 2 family protein [Sulfidibacter corallicola]QTD53805.1 nuclear transport factor 2 family protein [Sulfidibacter corallicola]
MIEAPRPIETFYEALVEQNGEKLRTVLTDDFTFQSPMSRFDTPEGFVSMVVQFGGTVETPLAIVDGDRVACTFVYRMTSPGNADIPMCDIFELRDGRIKSVVNYANPADFPNPEAS